VSQQRRLCFCLLLAARECESELLWYCCCWREEKGDKEIDAGRRHATTPVKQPGHNREPQRHLTNNHSGHGQSETSAAASASPMLLRRSACFSAIPASVPLPARLPRPRYIRHAGGSGRLTTHVLLRSPRKPASKPTDTTNQHHTRPHTQV